MDTVLKPAYNISVASVGVNGMIRKNEPVAIGLTESTVGNDLLSADDMCGQCRSIIMQSLRRTEWQSN